MAEYKEIIFVAVGFIIAVTVFSILVVSPWDDGFADANESTSNWVQIEDRPDGATCWVFNGWDSGIVCGEPK